MREFRTIKIGLACALVMLMASAFAAAQYPSRDQGQYRIMSARYGTERNSVDVTARLKQLARNDVNFRMGNSTFGVDPDPGRVKTLRIFARGPRNESRMFEYREGSVVDGSVFSGWRGGQWGNEPWNGGWNGPGNGGGNVGGGYPGNGYPGNGYPGNGNPGGSADVGSYRIVNARYGTQRRNVDVTARLKQLARNDVRFRMGNSTFGVDPDPGHVKTLRIYARGPRGETRTFEFREGSTVDGSVFTGWGRGDWGNERWDGRWEMR
jgi:hypothetical protein